MEALTAATGAMALLFVALMLALTVRSFSRGELPRNALLGIRTKATQRSDAAWNAGHEAVLPGLRILAWVSAAGAVLVVVVAFLTRSDPDASNAATLIALGLAMAAVVGLLIYLAHVASKAANAAG